MTRATWWILFGSIGCANTPEPQPHEIVMAAPTEEVFSYASGTSTYGITSHRVIVQNIDGNENRIATILRARVTTRSDTFGVDGTARVTFSVDTVLEVAAPTISPSAAQSGAGTTLTARLLSTGQLVDIDDSNVASPAAQQLLPIVRQFFPRIPNDGVEPAVEWIDTTTATRQDGGTDVEVTAIIASRAGDWRDDDGTRVLTVSWVADYTLSGAGAQLGQRFTLDGRGRTVGQHRLGIDGLYRGTTSSDTSTATVTIANLGITFPLQQTGADTIELTRLIPN